MRCLSARVRLAAWIPGLHELMIIAYDMCLGCRLSSRRDSTKEQRLVRAPKAARTMLSQATCSGSCYTARTARQSTPLVQTRLPKGKGRECRGSTVGS